MSEFKIDVTKFHDLVDPTQKRKQFQGLAHMAEIAERHEGNPFVFVLER